MSAATDTVSDGRRRAMLRTAMGPTIAAALADPLVIEVMINPDGVLRLDRLGEGRIDTQVRYDPAQVERIIRLVASHGRTEVHAGSPAIIESCPQRILLPNDRAIEPQSRAAYERFGLNKRQIELVARATPKRRYYLQSTRGNRLFELGLGPIALALCGASDPASQVRIDALLAEHGARQFASRFLAGAGLDWAAALLADFPQEPRPLEQE